ncbi:MAG: TPM domain-containing protein, partial [Bacteroidota bacterium]
MKKIILGILCLIGFATLAQVPDRPSPAKLYNNLSVEFPDFLSPDQAALLEEKLEVFSNETSNQICIVVVDDLNGDEASHYSTELGNKWGVGKAGKNNGIVILIKPTGGKGQRNLFISVGYGLEGAIPDLATKRIRDEEMYPYMAQGQFYEALNHATDKLMQLAKGEINVKDYTRGSGRERGGLSTFLILAIIIIIMIIRMFRGGGGGRTYSGIGQAMMW